MYKIDFENEQRDIILTKQYSTLEELFLASLTVHRSTMYEVSAYIATAYIGDLVLLCVSIDDLSLEYNKTAFVANPELYELLSKNTCFRNAESWSKTPTVEELIEYQLKSGSNYVSIGEGWMKLTTKHFEWTLEDTPNPWKHLRHFAEHPGEIYNEYKDGTKSLVFKLEDFIDAQGIVSVSRDMLISVNYKDEF